MPAGLLFFWFFAWSWIITPENMVVPEFSEKFSFWVKEVKKDWNGQQNAFEAGKNLLSFTSPPVLSGIRQTFLGCGESRKIYLKKQ